MSSRDGFARMDMDVGYDSDPKTVAYARLNRDHVRTACGLELHQATMRASWKADRRLTLIEAAPAWWLDDPAEFVAGLQAVGMLDDDGRIPEHAFVAWTARARASSEAARVAAEARWSKGSGRAAASPAQSDGTAPAVRPHSEGNAAAMPRQTDSLTASQPAGLPAGRPGRSSRAREAQPPPAGAEAPSSAAPGEMELVPEPPHWPGRGAPRPSTLAEAKANLATVRHHIGRPTDPRQRQAEALVRELEASNGSAPAEQPDDQPVDLVAEAKRIFADDLAPGPEYEL